MTEKQHWPDPVYLTKDHAINMTLRDYFAAKAMQAILPQYENVFDDETASEGDPSFPELLATDAYVMADAMLKARGQ